jgi:hypothetical protein
LVFDGFDGVFYKDQDPNAATAAAQTAPTDLSRLPRQPRSLQRKGVVMTGTANPYFISARTKTATGTLVNASGSGNPETIYC